MTIETTSPVPHHVEEAVATIALHYVAHHREACALQKRDIESELCGSLSPPR